MHNSEIGVLHFRISFVYLFVFKKDFDNINNWVTTQKQNQKYNFLKPPFQFQKIPFSEAYMAWLLE